jgi:hypothetical protein
VAYQLTLIRGRIEQRGDLSFGQLLSPHHSCLPGVPKAGRPADPGEEVDQGGTLEAEARQTAPLLVPLYRERRATGQGKPLTDSLPLRNAPDTARKPA